MEIKMVVDYIANNESALSVRNKLNETIDIANTTLYTNNKPTNISVGGIPKGTTFNQRTVTEMFDALLYAYVAPAVDFTTVPESPLVEHGNSLTSITFNIHITFGSETPLTLNIKRGNELIYGTSVSDSDVTFEYDCSSDPIVSNTMFTVVVQDNYNSRMVTKTFMFGYPYYYGVLNQPQATQEDIKDDFKVMAPKGTIVQKYTSVDQYPFIAYPVSWGDLDSIFDTNSFNITDAFTKQSLDVVGLDGESVPYTIYALNHITSIENYKMRFEF